MIPQKNVDTKTTGRMLKVSIVRKIRDAGLISATAAVSIKCAAKGKTTTLLDLLFTGVERNVTNSVPSPIRCPGLFFFLVCSHPNYGY